MAEEVVLPFPQAKDRVPLATRFRSTWLSSSLKELRERGLFDRYREQLPREFHEAVLDSVAGTWLPVEAASAHYQACDALGLSPAEQLEIGRAVTRHLHGTILGTLVKLARAAGVSPWLPFGSLDRIWNRIWMGGAVGVTRLGPCEARIEVVGWPCARVPYCRVAMRGVLQAVTELFCKQALVKELPTHCSATTLGYRVAWS